MLNFKTSLTAALIIGALAGCTSVQQKDVAITACEGNVVIVEEKVGLSTRIFVENTSKDQPANGAVVVRYRPDTDSGLTAESRFRFDLAGGEKQKLDTWEGYAYPQVTFANCSIKKQ